MCKRFKLDVICVQDLNGASDDRIREELRAFLRGLKRNFEGDEDGFGNLASMYACLVLNEQSIIELSRDLEGVIVRVIDCMWRKSTTDCDHTYRGVRDVSIVGLDDLFNILTGRVWPHGGLSSYERHARV